MSVSKDTIEGKAAIYARLCVEMDHSQPLLAKVEPKFAELTWIQQLYYKALPFSFRVYLPQTWALGPVLTHYDHRNGHPSDNARVNLQSPKQQPTLLKEEKQRDTIPNNPKGGESIRKKMERSNPRPSPQK